MDSVKKDISDYLLALEKKYDLLSWEINSVFIWEIIRVKLYLFLQEKVAGDFFESNEILKSRTKLKIHFLRLWRNGIRKNPFFSNFRGNVLFFESGRKYRVDDFYVDIYTFFLREQFKKENILFEVFETNYKFDDVGTKDNRIQHIDFLKIFAKVISSRVKMSFSKNDNALISKIEKGLLNEFNVKINLEILIAKEFKTFKTEKYLYKKLFTFQKTKKIFFVNYSDYFSLLSAAKDLNIQTVEIQHGLIIKEALIYNFPNSVQNQMNYFPSKFYVWDGFNYNSGILPLSSDNIISNPFNHLEFMKSRYDNISRDSKTILVASQPVHSKEIQNYILKNAIRMNDYKFIYKLHPMEFGHFFDSQLAQSLTELSNVEFIRNEESIYKLLKSSKYILGIYSTSLFEAEMFGCIPIILSTDSIFTQSLEDNENSIVVHAGVSLAEYIAKNL